MEELQESLYEACKRGDRPDVADIISKGADVDKADRNGDTPLMLACDEGHIEVVRALLVAKGITGVALNESGMYELMRQAGTDDVDMMSLVRNGYLQLEAKSINVNAMNKNGWTALMNAACRGYCNIVRVLLEAKGIDVNKANSNGYTALYWACHGGKLDTVEVLLEAKGIDVNTARSGRTPLTAAASNGHDSVVDVLLEAKGINVNKTVDGGSTALMCAASEGHVNVVRTLLAAEGIDINFRNENGLAALHEVTAGGRRMQLEFLMIAEEEGDHKEVAHIEKTLRNYRVIEKMLRDEGAWDVFDEDNHKEDAELKTDIRNRRILEERMRACRTQ